MLLGYCISYRIVSKTEKINDIRVIFETKEDVLTFINNLEQYPDGKIIKEGKAYTEDISTFKNDVERVLYITDFNKKLKIRLDVYTDKEFDDNWIILTPKKISYLIGLLYGYYEHSYK